MALAEPMFLIHHLTDIHIGPLHYAAARKLPFVPKEQGSRNVDLYLDHLRHARDESLPNLVIISGDLTSYASEGEMNAAHDALAEIVKLVSKKRSAWRDQGDQRKAPFVVMVPGNHDLDWSQDSHRTRTERYARLADGLYQDGALLSAAYWSARDEVCWDFGNDANLFVYLLDTTHLGGTQDPDLVELHKRLSSEYKKLPSASGEEFRVLLDKIEKEARKDPGYIEPADLKRMRDRAASVPASRLKIAVLHHNPTTVPSDDIEAFDVIINAGYLKQSLALAGFDLVFFGHRHVLHCTQERLTAARQGGPQRVHFVSGDAIGCKEHAPFVEVSLFDTARAPGNELPACYFAVRSYRHSGGRYVADPEPLSDGTLSTPLQQALDCVGVNVGRNEPFSSREHLLKSIAMLLPPLQQLQSKMVDWSENSNAWIKEFHYQLSTYRRIYATDAYRRSSAESPLFAKYLREQYVARMATLRSGASRRLVYSTSVYGAILRTGWKPDRVMWGDWQVAEATADDLDGNLEIVRVLMWPADAARDRVVLETLDFDHQIFAIPLFIIDPARLGAQGLADFAIGFGPGSQIFKCYEYCDDRGKVQEMDLGRGFELSETFSRILEDPELKTIDEFLGYRVMIRDPQDLKRFAEKYDRERRASKKILEFLRTHLRPEGAKVGLEVGCGTGNYTIPFANDFGTIYGLDINDEMLEVARAKSTKVRWMRANGIRTGLDPASCDAVWLISSLHYFEGESQKYLFKEIHRVLRPGGVLVADTEFAEQHASFWLVEYFPGLRNRFKNVTFSKEKYESWLREVGFRDCRFEHMDYDTSQGDAFLRIGQHEPGLYLKQEIRDAIPAFKQMNFSELQAGLKSLKRAIESGSIEAVIQEYQSKATMPGDLGFIVASK